MLGGQNNPAPVFYPFFGQGPDDNESTRLQTSNLLYKGSTFYSETAGLYFKRFTVVIISTA
jgi:hypothetical protein